MIKIIIIWRAPGPYGASPTQPYKCGQYVKINVKVNVKTNAVLANAEIKKLTLTLTF
jgi:hypothetical protein